MSKTVVGLFRNTIEAQNVKHELVGQGYSASDIRVVADDQQNGAPSGLVPSGTSSTGTGLGATISNFFRSFTGGSDDEQHYAEGVRKGAAILSVTVPDGQENKTADLLEQYGAQDVNDQATGTSTSARPASREVSDDTMVPIVQEEMTVGKRQVQRGGVRVYSHLVETPVEEKILLREEHVHVDRQRVDRPATEADFQAFQEGTMELSDTAEEAVVSKKARVVEEIVVGKQSSETMQTIRDTVRHTEVETEQLAGTQPRSAAPPDTEFRTHFQTHYANSGRAYESYAPAYQYGQTLANDPRYASGSWSSVEANAQKDWASQGTGKWEDFKGAVEQGWTKVRGAASAKTAS